MPGASAWHCCSASASPSTSSITSRATCRDAGAAPYLRESLGVNRFELLYRIGRQRPHRLGGDGLIEVRRLAEPDHDAREIGIREREAQRGLRARAVLGAERGERRMRPFVVRGVGVGPPAGASSSSGRVIAVSGFSRKVGSPLAGTSRVSVSPCASVISEARAGVQVWAAELSRQVKS
jgi:hypothetical protein